MQTRRWWQQPPRRSASSGQNKCAITKAAVFAVFLIFWRQGVVTTLGILVVFPHLVVAALFAWWLRKGK